MTEHNENESDYEYRPADQRPPQGPGQAGVTGPYPTAPGTPPAPGAPVHPHLPHQDQTWPPANRPPVDPTWPVRETGGGWHPGADPQAPAGSNPGRPAGPPPTYQPVAGDQRPQPVPAPPPAPGHPGASGQTWTPHQDPWGPPSAPLGPAGPPAGGALPPTGGHWGGWSNPPGGGSWAPPPSSHRHRGRGAVAAAVAGGVALAAVLGVVVGHVAWQPNTSPASSSSPVQTVPNGGSSSPGFGSGGEGSSGSGSGSSTGPSDAASIAKDVDPGLVDINTNLGYASEQAAGTGMVLTPNGEILTNNHVIDQATRISVTDIGNGKTYSASVVGYDKTHDVAVLQLSGASGLQTVKPGNSGNLSVGQGVVGIGNAGGSGGTPSYAGGTITALNQSITATDQGDGTSEQLKGLIQTDANIQPGDSGGPLVNTNGQVIGMDTAASAGFQFNSPGSSTPQGFSIPINQAISIAKAIVAGKASATTHIGSTAFLGVDVQAANASSGSGSGSGGFGGFGGFGGSGGSGGFGGFGGSGSSNSNGSGGSGSGSSSGAVIAQVISGTPAANAGLASGDVITGLDGQTVTSPNSLTTVMLQQKPGDTVTLTYTDSSGQTHTVKVQLASGPPQ